MKPNGHISMGWIEKKLSERRVARSEAIDDLAWQHLDERFGAARSERLAWAQGFWTDTEQGWSDFGVYLLARKMLYFVPEGAGEQPLVPLARMIKLRQVKDYQPIPGNDRGRRIALSKGRPDLPFGSTLYELLGSDGYQMIRAQKFWEAFALAVRDEALARLDRKQAKRIERDRARPRDPEIR